MARELWPHQPPILRWMDYRRHFLLALEMRLGKTVLTILWGKKHAGTALPALVVAPLSVLPGWEDELKLEGQTVSWLRGRDLPYFRIVLPRILPALPGWYLINWEGLLANPWLADLPWGAVILDESTRIKNPRAKITRLCLAGFRGVNHRILLSGLAAPEELSEIVCQMLFLFGEFMGCRNYWAWRDTYYVQLGDYDWIPAPGMREEIIREVRLRSYPLTRDKAGIGGKLITETRHVELPAAARKEYRRAEADWVAEVDGKEYSAKYVMVVDNLLSRIAGGPHKDSELLSLLTGDLKGEPVVVWFRYNEELRRVAAKLANAGIGHAAITGETPVRRRGEYVSQFGRRFPVLLLQRKCGKFGLNLSVSDTAINYSLGWSVEDADQSSQRIIHGSKKTPCLQIDLVTRDTVDEDVAEGLRIKAIDGRTLMGRVLTAAKRRQGATG